MIDENLCDELLTNLGSELSKVLPDYKFESVVLSGGRHLAVFKMKDAGDIRLNGWNFCVCNIYIEQATKNNDLIITGIDDGKDFHIDIADPNSFDVVKITKDIVEIFRIKQQRFDNYLMNTAMQQSLKKFKT